MLGRGYRMLGRVAHGDKRGRTIGFPTANLFLHRHSTPVQGVFAVELYGLDTEPHYGVANVGTRPTVDGTRTLLEVHLFDFAGDIYGRQVAVEFVHKIRAEKRFDSFPELKAQIEQDAQQARDFLRIERVSQQPVIAERSVAISRLVACVVWRLPRRFAPRNDGCSCNALSA